MHNLRIEFLSAHPECIPELARWHHAEWGAYMPYWTEADAVKEFQSHTGGAVIPTTLVALEGDALRGSVSLIVHDLEEWKGTYSPWLASLYVRPDARGRGIGGELVRRALEAARASGVKRLYVVAAHSEDFYARQGWRLVERTKLRGVDTAVMAWDFP